MIGARQQSVVHGVFAAQFVSAARRLDGIDVADQVGDGDIGGGQLFHVALFRREIGDGSGVAVLGDLVAAAAANRSVGIVVNLATGNVRRLRIEQRGQSAQDAALGLAAQSQQNEIMARKNGVDDLRHDRVVVSDDAGENRAALPEFRDQVVAHFVLHAPGTQPLFAKRTVAQFAERPRQTHDEQPPGKQLLLGLYAVDGPPRVRSCGHGQRPNSINHEGHKGTRRNRTRAPSCTFVSFVVCGFEEANSSVSEHGHCRRPSGAHARSAADSAGWPRSRK